MASKRRFEFLEGTSSKFWEIELDGARTTVCFGRIGTAGSAKDKTFGSAGEAEREASKLIAEKTKKGYVEVGGAPSKAAATAPATAPVKPPASKTKKDSDKDVVASPALLRALAFFDRMVAALKANKDVRAKNAKVEPVSEAALAAWEATHQVTLPEDYRALLRLRGGLDLTWETKKKSPDGEVFRATFKVTGPPAPIRADHPDLFGFRFHLDYWARHFRLKAGSAPSVVHESLTDGSELSDLPGTFSELLLDELPWFGVGDEFSDGQRAQIAVDADGLRDLTTIVDALIDPPSVDPTSVESLLHALSGASDDVEPSDAATRLVALGAEEAAPRILEYAKASFASGENAHEWVDLMRHLWVLEPRLLGELTDLVEKNPPSESEYYAKSMRVMAYAVAGDGPKMIAALRDFDLLTGATTTLLEALLRLGDDDSMRAVADGVTKLNGFGRDRETIFRIVRALAELGRGEGFEVVANRLERRADEKIEHGKPVDRFLEGILENEGRRLRCAWGSGYEEKRAIAVAWLRDLARQARLGVSANDLRIDWPGPEYVVKATTPERWPIFHDPQRLTHLEVSRPDTLEPITAFKNVRHLQLVLRGDWSSETNRNVVIEDLTPLVALTELESLTVHGPLTDEVGFEALAPLSRLRVLEVRSEDMKTITARGLERILRALRSGLPNLEILRLNGSPIGDAGICALAEESSVSRLSTLELRDTKYGAKGAAALRTSPHLKHCLLSAWSDSDSPEHDVVHSGSPPS